MAESENKMDSALLLQEDISSRIIKAFQNFKKSPKERLNKSYCETRLESLEQLWVQFTNGHADLLREFARKDLIKAGYMKDDLYTKTEDEYMACKCMIKELLEKFTVNKDQTSTGFDDVKLAKVNIPMFSGKYSEWNTFKDLFVSLVHKRDRFDDVQKLYYLKSHLTGEAEQFLRYIPVTEANYARCWELLQQRFDNKKYVCNYALKRLFALKALNNESPHGLKELMDTTNDCLSILKILGIEVGSWDVIIIHILTAKLDPETRRQWEFSIADSNTSSELPTWSQFQEFITGRYRAIEFLPFENRVRNTKSQPNHQTVNVRAHHATTNVQCAFCSGDHKINLCKKFLGESVDSRREFVMSHNICFCCMGNNHAAKYCQRNIRCKTCKGRHNTVLHPKGNWNKGSGEASDGHLGGDGSTGGGPPPKDNNNKPPSNSESVFSTVSHVSTVASQVLLATALVKTRTMSGKLYMIRALLDQGSQSSFVTEGVVQSLGLKKTPVVGKISGVGGNSGLVSKAMVEFEIASRVNPNIVLKVKAYVLKSITSLIPSRKCEMIEWDGLQDLVLADPEFNVPSHIDVLLGAEVYGRVLLEGVRKGTRGSPVAQSTTLGWILSGAVDPIADEREESEGIKVMHCQINDQLKRFWELEEIKAPDEIKMMSPENQYAIRLFNETTQRDEDGRYIVRLPFKVEEPEVTNSLRIAKKRLCSLEQRLNKDPDLKVKYGNALKEYVELQHMELIPEEEIDNPKAIYLPHHAVVREDRDTTKVRPVFDASCKGDNQRSLNDCLIVGPRKQNELRHTMMRWRLHQICLTADIVKMYRQIKVSKKDTDYQRILWRNEDTSQIEHFRMLRVTFGVASAPFLAVSALQQVAMDYLDDYWIAAQRVFLQAFRRFVARRGHCSDIWSDNATNFVGAASELKKLFIEGKRSMLDEVAALLATNGCNWHFIPSRSPNFGGLWEAGVKSVKTHLKRIIGQSTLTFEEMTTVLAQVEACLNSRPLAAVPCDKNDDDLTVLTPGHFLVGESLLAPPERNVESVNISSLRRWQYTQRMVQDFWRRWSREYLSKFYHRYQWSSQGSEIKIGDIVLVKEDGLPTSRWLYGRVVEVHPGLDNIVRVVSLKVRTGVLKRSVNKLCRLPIAD